MNRYFIESDTDFPLILMIDESGDVHSRNDGCTRWHDSSFSAREVLTLEQGGFFIAIEPDEAEAIIGAWK